MNKSQNFPTIENSHMDSVDINEDGCMVLGASSLTGRYWLGSLWYFRDPEDAPDDSKSLAAVETNSGVCDGKWVTNRKLIAGLDSGCVCLCNLSEDFSELHIDEQVEEHENGVSSVSVTCDKLKAVSGSKDARIKIWDLTGFSSSASYKANYDAVWCVACHPKQSNIFLSCSEDGKTLLWDTRNNKPAKMLGCSTQIPTCVTWHPTDEYTVAVGTQDGNVVIQDTRQEKNEARNKIVHSRPLRRLQYSKTRSGWLASVSEDCTMVVTDTLSENLELIYKDARHTDFVQDLCWDPNSNKCYTSGWDKQVFSHDVSRGAITQINGVSNSSMET